MTLLELMNNSHVPITVLDSMTGKRVLINRNHLDRNTEAYGELEIFDIHIGVDIGKTGFSNLIHTSLLVYAYHPDIERVKSRMREHR